MITLVLGGQYGGEGKGKISAFLAEQNHFDIVCRTGGVNSKHTAHKEGKAYDLRQIPTAATTSFKGKIVYGAGSLVHIPTLLEEMEMLGVSRSQILIDSQTGILTEENIQSQRSDSRYITLGSTMTGTGHATAQRALRKLPIAKDFSELTTILGNVSMFLHEQLAAGKNVMIEGHQSSGLSNFHGDYPYTSNRDSTAAALLSELGIGPRYPMRIVLVIKVFPTRNHNGRLPNEMTVEEADALNIKEYGGGSWGIENNRRRVGRIDLEDIKRAVYLNTPTEIAVTGMDYLDPNSRLSTDWENLSEEGKNLIGQIEEASDVPVSLISTGPETNSVICR
ncbi:MAG: adenylosuccinate synthetase [Patescibacteria group bacterium]